jgi:hypothetical protein
MHWIRRNNRFGSLAALVALAIQLVVSFAHVHLTDIQGSSPTAVTQNAQGGGNTAPGPDDDDRFPAGHKYCAICAALNQVSSSVLPTVELPAAPADHSQTWFADLPRAKVSSPFHFLFQARAPPHSA